MRRWILCKLRGKILEVFCQHDEPTAEHIRELVSLLTAKLIKAEALGKDVDRGFDPPAAEETSK